MRDNLHQEDCIFRNDMLDAIGHGTTYTSEDLQQIIKNLPSVKPVAAWHKVEEEGCPKAAGKYLVVRMTEYGYKTTIAMWLGWDETWAENNVVAWMPLPEWET